MMMLGLFILDYCSDGRDGMEMNERVIKINVVGLYVRDMGMNRDRKQR